MIILKGNEIQKRIAKLRNPVFKPFHLLKHYEFDNVEFIFKSYDKSYFLAVMSKRIAR